MSRPNTASTMLVVFAAIALAALGSGLYVLFGGSIPDWVVANAAQERRGSKAQRLLAQLQRTVNLDKGIDPNTPLKDAIEYLADKYDMTMLVDSKAFEEIGVQKVEEQPVQMPKMVGVSMATVLRLLLGQIKGDVHCGTYSIQDDHILITTTQQASNAETWTADSDSPAPAVDVDCLHRPLQDVLNDMRELTRINILVDARVTDKVRKPVTATLGKVPVDTAVRLLADMVDLRAVAVDNVLYVTSPENAKELQAQQEARARQRQPKKSGDPLNGAPKLNDKASAGPPPAMGAIRQPRPQGTDDEKRQAALEAGLEWLARHQAADGHWSLSGFHIDGKCNCTAQGGEHDVAGTAFALLPLVGTAAADQANYERRYARNVERGLKWLLTKQGADGAFSSSGYEHALATWTVCEAYRLGCGNNLKGPAQRALNCCVAWQHTAGGWRYTPRTPGDLSVSAWFIQALASGRRAGLNIPQTTWDGANNYLESIALPDLSGFGYQQSQPSPSMTACGLLCGTQVFHEEIMVPGLAKGRLYLSKLPPSVNFRNLYYYYYATKVMTPDPIHGAMWNRKMTALLLDQQDWGEDAQRLHQIGSWSPAGEAWGSQLGRLGMTSFALLILQTRHQTPQPKPM